MIVRIEFTSTQRVPEPWESILGPSNHEMKKNTYILHDVLYMSPTHSPVMSENFGVLSEGIWMVAQRVSRNNIYNIIDVREFIISCAIKHHSGTPITIGNIIL